MFYNYANMCNHQISGVISNFFYVNFNELCVVVEITVCITFVQRLHDVRKMLLHLT